MLLDRKWEMNDPTGWICARSAHMRSVLGASNPIKIASGGVGGSYDNGANFANWVTSCPSLDIVSVHYYRNDGLDDQSFVSKGKGKLVMMEEWTTHQGSGQAGQYKAGAYAMNKIGLPWMLWQILPHQTCSTRDSDNSGLVINGGIDVKGPMTAAKNSKAAQDCEYIVHDILD